MPDETLAPAECLNALKDARKFNKCSHGILCALLQRTYLGFGNTLICGEYFYFQQTKCPRNRNSSVSFIQVNQVGKLTPNMKIDPVRR